MLLLVGMVGGGYPSMGLGPITTPGVWKRSSTTGAISSLGFEVEVTVKNSLI